MVVVPKPVATSSALENSYPLSKCSQLVQNHKAGLLPVSSDRCHFSQLLHLVFTEHSMCLTLCCELETRDKQNVRASSKGARIFVASSSLPNSCISWHHSSNSNNGRSNENTYELSFTVGFWEILLWVSRVLPECMRLEHTRPFLASRVSSLYFAPTWRTWGCGPSATDDTQWWAQACPVARSSIFLLCHIMSAPWPGLAANRQQVAKSRARSFSL